MGVDSLDFFLRTIAPFISVVCLAGCLADAPHDNPLDPRSERYSGTGMLTGHVFIKNQASVPVPSALVSISDETLATFTDSLGNFSFASFPIGIVPLVITKSGFVPDTVQATLAAGAQKNYQIALNALPTVISAKVTTSRIAVWFPSTRYFAYFAASVSDLNGITDLDSVWLSVDTVQFAMSYSVSAKEFELTLHSDTLSGNNLQVLVGKPLYIVARDLEGARAASSAFYVSRIIEEEPVPIYPKSIPTVDTTTTTPQFRWSEPLATFGFTYSIVLARVDNANTETVVWSRSTIGSYQLSYPYDGPVLVQGNYSWTISIIDDFGNSSISKEYGFVVQ